MIPTFCLDNMSLKFLRNFASHEDTKNAESPFLRVLVSSWYIFTGLTKTPVPPQEIPPGYLWKLNDPHPQPRRNARPESRAPFVQPSRLPANRSRCRARRAWGRKLF